jgi:hypothetical protein
LGDYIAFSCRLSKFKNRNGYFAPENESTAIFRNSAALYQPTQRDAPEPWITPSADKRIMKAGITLKEVAK